MSANIDKSLDDIISSKPRINRKRTSAIKKGVSKRATLAKKRTATRVAKTKEAVVTAAAVAKSNNEDPSQFATRVLISSLPHDITESSLRDYLTNNIGPVSKVIGSYNSTGKPTGTFTVTFKKAGLALEAMKRLHGSSVDGGKQQLRVEILYDPSAKPLAQRLNIKPAGGNAAAAAAGRALKVKAEVAKKTKKAGNNNNRNKKDQAPKADENKSNDNKAKNPKNRRNRRTVRPTKTAEELDAEMTDYFAAKDSAAPAASIEA